MRLTSETCDALADCCDYPTPDLAARALGAAKRIDSEVSDPAVVAALDELATWAESVGHAATQERYTQLFDLKPVATLNISHHLLGDTYQRGALLAGLAGEHKKLGIQHEHDLPDYLPTLLRLLGSMEDPADRHILAHTIVVPGLRKVLEKLEQSPGPYPPLLKSICELLAHEIPAGDAEVQELSKPLEAVPCST